MNIALVMGNYKKQGYPPLGVLYLAGYLRKYNPQCIVQVFDEFPPEQTLLEANFDLIGFSCMSIQYPDVCDYAERIRGLFHGYLLIGGVHTTLTKQIPEWADFGIVGEGEATLSELVHALTETHPVPLENVPGLLIRRGNHVITTRPRLPIKDLDTIPFPAWDMIDMHYYLMPNNVYGTVVGRGLSMLTSRGCCYHCQFCSASKMWGGIRFHSAEYVAEMIKHLISHYQIQHIWLADDHFAIHKTRLRKLATILEKEHICIGMGISCRVDSYDEEMSQLLQRIGVKAIALGLETGSDRVLRKIKNGCTLTVAQEDVIIRKMCADGFQVHGMFMLNTPGETLDDLKTTVEWIHSLPLCKVSTAIAVPYYGTPWWDIALDQGIVDADPNNCRQLRAYNMKFLEADRPVFKTDIPRDILKKTYNELTQYNRSLFYFDWENR